MTFRGWGVKRRDVSRLLTGHFCEHMEDKCDVMGEERGGKT